MKASATPTAIELPHDVSDREQNAALSAALAALPVRERTALELVYLEGLTHEQAAAALGWSRGTVGTYVSRGLERLRTKLGVMNLASVAATVTAALLSAEQLDRLTESAWLRATTGLDPIMTANWWTPGNAKVATLFVVVVGMTVGGAVAIWPQPEPRPEPAPTRRGAVRRVSTTRPTLPVSTTPTIAWRVIHLTA